jgi:hypothetical protein
MKGEKRQFLVKQASLTGLFAEHLTCLRRSSIVYESIEERMNEK